MTHTMKVLAVAAVILLVGGGAGTWQVVQDLEEAQDGFFKLAKELKTAHEVGAKLLAHQTALEADNEILMTPAHKEALKMWSQFPEVCKQQTLGDLMQGDYGCAVEALPASSKGEPFPSGKLRADILKDPAKALASGKAFLKDRCARIRVGQRPQICFQYPAS